MKGLSCKRPKKGPWQKAELMGGKGAKQMYSERVRNFEWAKAVGKVGIGEREREVIRNGETTMEQKEKSKWERGTGQNGPKEKMQRTTGKGGNGKWGVGDEQKEQRGWEMGKGE